jgi:hypothetical protein
MPELEKRRMAGIPTTGVNARVRVFVLKNERVLRACFDYKLANANFKLQIEQP